MHIILSQRYNLLFCVQHPACSGGNSEFDSTILTTTPASTTPLMYPCFFVNPDKQGIPGVLMWIGVIAFVSIGFLLFGLHEIERSKKLNKANLKFKIKERLL